MFLLLTTDGAVTTGIGAERPHSLSFYLQSGGDQERKHKRRRGEYYSIPTSLIIAALKKMLPIGLNMCTPGDQELISVAKKRYSLVSLQGGNEKKLLCGKLTRFTSHHRKTRMMR